MTVSVNLNGDIGEGLGVYKVGNGKVVEAAVKVVPVPEMTFN